VVVTYKVVLQSFKIQNYYKQITLDILGIAAYNIILGLPWLQKYNLIID